MFSKIKINLMIMSTDIQTSQLFTGTKNLINDATKALMILIPVVAVLLVGYFFIRKGAADEMDQKKWQNRIQTVLICTVFGLMASVLINIISHYYQV